MQTLQGLIQRQHLLAQGCDERTALLQFDLDATAAVLRAATAREVDWDAPHGARADREEVATVLPVDTALLDQLQVGFLNQLGGLQLGGVGETP